VETEGGQTSDDRPMGRTREGARDLSCDSASRVAGPATDRVAWILAAASLVGLAVWTLAFGASHDFFLAALSGACWYAAGAVVVDVAWRRWSPGWALTIPWAASVVYANVVLLLAPLFNGVWRELSDVAPQHEGSLAGQLDRYYGAASFSVTYVVSLLLGLVLGYAVWRQSRAWHSTTPDVHADLVDSDARRAVLLWSLLLLSGYVITGAYGEAGYWGSPDVVPARDVVLLVAVFAIAYYQDAAPEAAVWVFAIGGTYLGARAIEDVVGMAPFLDGTPVEGAIWGLIVLSVIVALTQIAWAVFVLFAAVAQHSLTGGRLATDAAIATDVVVTPADDEGKSLPQSS